MAKRKPGPKTPWQKRVRYNRARCTERLKPIQVQGLTEADAFAGRIGRPLNAFVTIKLSEAVHPLKAFQRGSKALGAWFRRWGGELTWIYVWEAKGGFHLHALAHVPGSIRLEFLEALTQAFSGHDVHAARRTPGPSAMAYLCKGTDTATHMRLRGPSNVIAKRQGIITWKRCGMSQNVGPAARRKAEIEAGNGINNCAETCARPMNDGDFQRTRPDAGN